MKRTNTPSDALNRNKAVVDPGDGLPLIELPLDGNFGGAKGDPGEGVPTGGEPLQVVRKNVAGTDTEWVTPTKSMVGLSNVDNTADVDKPISTATQSALDGKASATALTNGLSGKADLSDGKVPVSQLPTDALVTDANVAAVVDGAQTGPAIDARINTQVTPQVEQITADYIAGDQAVIDAAAAAVDANPKITELENRPLGRHLGTTEHLDTVLTVGGYYVDADAEATLALGFPVARAGKLRVDRFSPSGGGLVQIYYPFRYPGFFVRYFYSGAPYTGAPYGSGNNGWQEFRNWADTLAALNLKADRNLVPAERSDPTQWAAVGDSLTDGYSNAIRWDEVDSYPSKLQAVLPAGTTVTNYGQSGATSDQINMLLGLTPFRVRINGGTIPATGPVNLTVTQVIGGWNDTQDLTFSGHLEGIYGSLARTSGSWTFTRSATGEALARTYGTFRAFNGAMPSLAGIGGHSMILGYGRNDISKVVKGMEASIPDHVIRAYVDAYESMNLLNKQIVMLGTITRTDENPDSDGFKMVQEIRARVRELFPTHFLDLQGYLTGAEVWTHTGITPTQTDLEAQALGMTPPSLFDDVTHYNRATAQAIAEDLIAPFIKQKGWV